MIKLKSLFRRGQGPSGSSKHSSTQNHLRGAASASSLNSIGISTTSSSSTTKSSSTSKSLKKSQYTGSNDRFDAAAFHASHESLDNIKSPLAQKQLHFGGGDDTASMQSAQTGPMSSLTAMQHVPVATSPSSHSSTSPTHLLDPKDQSDVGISSCYSNSVQDLLSDELNDDCPYDGTEQEVGMLDWFFFSSSSIPLFIYFLFIFCFLFIFF